MAGEATEILRKFQLLEAGDEGSGAAKIIFGAQSRCRVLCTKEWPAGPGMAFMDTDVFIGRAGNVYQFLASVGGRLLPFTNSGSAAS